DGIRDGHVTGVQTCALPISRIELGRLSRAILASIRYTLARFAKDGADAGDGDIVYVEENRETNPFEVYGRAGAPCPRCGAPIKRSEERRVGKECRARRTAEP